VSVIFVTLSFSNLFKKSHSFIFLFSLIWFLMGLADFIIRFLRVTPFEANDFSYLTKAYGYQTIYEYLGIIGTILCCLIIIGSVAGVIILFKKLKPSQRCTKRAIIGFVAAVLLMTLMLTSLTLTGIAPKKFPNLVEAYNDYGFVFCFGSSVFNRGVDRPDDYSEEKIQSILGDLEPVKENSADDLPNVIFVQLESFFDVSYLKEVVCSEDPTPFFTSLKSQYPAGLLHVPSIGAGTANTEVEVIAGISVHNFGTGEYPYKTVLRKMTCESLAYNLGEIGHTSHAIHNNTGAFYDRNTVFPNLGFDAFSSIEYMYDVEYNEIGWAKDDIIITSVLEAMQNTAGKDYIHAISVQSHGKYPNVPVNEDQPIKVECEENQVEMEYFINQLHEVDKFMENLTDAIEALGEECIIVFYGDHLPTLDIGYEDLDGCTPYQTEYVVWNNCGIEKTDKDLYSYQLGSYVSSLIGVNNGIINRIHQKALTPEYKSYEEDLEMITYDMLGRQFLDLIGNKGEFYCNGGEPLYEPTDMTWGTRPISVTDVIDTGDYVKVLGINFNEYSHIYLNGKKVNTKFVSENELRISKNIDEGDEIFVAQISYEWIKLGQSESVTYKK
jgi:phosphoglycerol transferase MdoB-like AlkP superfamily enzyme